MASAMPTFADIYGHDPTVCICGAGNAAHVFSSLLVSWGCKVTVFADFMDEAERFRAAVEGNGGVLVKDRSDPSNVREFRGKPDVVSKDAADAVPQADIIIVALPSFAMRNVFTGLKPHLKQGAIIFVMPGVGGCEFVAREVLGEELKEGRVTVSGIVPMPLNCRIEKFGEAVDLASIKVAFDIAAMPMSQAGRAASVFSALLKRPTRSVGSFIGMGLNGGNANNHPPRLMAVWKDHVEGKVYPENPLFYETWDDESETWCNKISDERIAIWNAIVSKYPEVGPKNHLHDVRKYMAIAYKGQITDDSTIKNCFAKNVGLTGFHFPMKKSESEEGRWEIDFKNRYFMEDIPDGLCVYKGYGDLIGVPTPAIDEILAHFQKFLGKEYIKDGKLQGANAKETKAPQSFGFTTIDSLLKG
mmetsp:Transcript_38842/g.120822  ORF Transcript_38842/g.120822 Transcript_38842/m.120822 type:complete len:416 (-) Transcript_38842:298-1545(-)